MMKGDPELLKKLNQLLFDELTAINQYFVHTEMDENWGYDKLSKTVKSRAIMEMKHAEKLIERIIFLEGTPAVAKLGQINIGAEVPAQFEHDLNSEYTAVKHYNEGIKLATEVADNATKELLEKILKDEDAHVDELEMFRDQLAQMGIQHFLSTQV
jgi:bacterioferritin